MNDKKLIKALIVSGSIATGFALNSTGAMAAELDDAAVNNNVADNGEQDVVNEKIQVLNDAAEVVEGDAVAEEGYLNTAQEYINNNIMTVDTANEILDGSTAVMAQAKEKNDYVQAEYTTAVTDETAARNEYFEYDSKWRHKVEITPELEEKYNKAKELLSANENPEYKKAALAAEEENYRRSADEWIEHYRTEYEAGLIDEEDYAVSIKDIEDSYNYALGELRYYFDEMWEEDINDAKSIVEKYESQKAINDTNETQLDYLKTKYEQAVSYRQKAISVTRQSQQAYDRTIASFVKIIYLVDTYTLEESEGNNQTVLNETVQAMNDVADVVEGDAVAAESYLSAAQGYNDNRLITEDTATEILKGSTAVMEQAKEKNDVVKAEYALAVSDEVAAKEEYEKQLKNSGLEEITSQYNDIQDKYREAKEFLTVCEDEEYKRNYYNSEHDRITNEIDKASNGLREMYEAGEIDKETYDMIGAYYFNNYGLELMVLEEYFDEMWQSKINTATDTVYKSDSINALIKVAEYKIAPAKKDYEEKLAVEAAMQAAAERSQQAYDRTVTAYTETINLLNAQAGNGNTQEPTDEATEEITEETALSEDVYTVFNNVKAIVMENPELLQKVYALYNNEKAVETAKSAYNYVVANVDIRTINHYAKQLAGMDITPELVNTYLDMFTNWVNK